MIRCKFCAFRTDDILRMSHHLEQYHGDLIPPDMIKTRGISEITAAHVMQAEKCGCTIKLIARMQKTCGGYYLAVEPYMVRKTNPLAGITDVYNGILIKGNAVGGKPCTGNRDRAGNNKNHPRRRN